MVTEAVSTGRLDGQYCSSYLEDFRGEECLQTQKKMLEIYQVVRREDWS